MLVAAPVDGLLVAAPVDGLLVAAPVDGLLVAASGAGVASTGLLTSDVLPFLVAVAATIPAGMFTVGVILTTP